MSYAAPAVGSEFRIGNVLNRAFSICVANFPFFFIITLIVALPNLLIKMNQTVRQPSDFGPAFSMIGLSVVLGIVLNTIGEAIILYGAFQYLSGRPVQPAEAFQRAIARFLPLLGLGLLYGFAVGLGAVLLVVPGLILFVMWSVALPSCLVEGLSPIESLSRSSALTKGSRWPIFGAMVLVGLANGIGAIVLGLVLSPFGHLIATLITLVWTATWAAYWNCLLIMIYHDLRVAKEGIDTKQIAAVFD